MPIGRTRNVARMAEEASFDSDALIAGCLAARRAHLALSIGDFELLDVEGDVLAYERRHSAERLIVALNLGGRSHRLELADWASDCRLLLSTVARRGVGRRRRPAACGRTRA